jgi:predicted porin
MVACLLLPFTGAASTFQGIEKLQVHGFMTQGYFLTSDNAVLGASDDEHGSLDFREVGLNGSYQFSNAVSVALQGLYRKMGTDDEVRLDYAVLDWRIGRWTAGEWGVRLGRVKNPMGLYNETRDVAFTRPSVFLPQGLYYDRSRNLLHSTDGGQLYFNIQTDVGFFQFKTNVGRAENDNKELKMAIFGFDTPGELVSKRENYWSQISFESLSGDLELAFSYADIILDYKPGAGDPFAAGETRYRPFVLSAQYHWDDFSLTAEYLQQKNQFSQLGAFPDISISTEAYYLQGEYRFSPQVKGLLRFDAHYINKDDRDGEKASATRGVPAHRGFTEDWVVGLSWQPTRAWQFQAEYHWITGTSWLPAQANPDPTKLEKHWNLLALTASFRF